MKIINIIYLLTTIIILIACNPPKSDVINTPGVITINSKIINPKRDLKIGDSLIIYFEVPDTITVNGIKIKALASNDDAANIGLSTNKIIGSSITNNPTKNGCISIVNPVTLNTYDVMNLKNQNGKLFGNYIIIPQEKGVFFFEQNQNGYIGINNKSIQTRFTFNFGNIERNHQMLLDSAKAVNNFNLFLQGKKDSGFEIYGFKVD
jgi:hypothetical protein